MILSNKQIKERIEQGDIIITPYNEENLGSNSYDLHLSKHLAVYESHILDSKKENKLRRLEMTDCGYTLQPQTLYLGSTVEFTSTKNLVPFIEGKSSGGRLGISIHATAGKGDNGFAGYWTLEISVLQPVMVYPNMPIAQIIYFETGECDLMYSDKKDAKYANQSHLPKESKMYMNYNNELNKWK